MKAYVFVPLGVPGATSGSMFTPVQVENELKSCWNEIFSFKVELVASEPEIAGLDLLNKTKFSKVYITWQQVYLCYVNHYSLLKVRTVEPMPELTKVADAAEKMQVQMQMRRAINAWQVINI